MLRVLALVLTVMILCGCSVISALGGNIEEGLPGTASKAVSAPSFLIVDEEEGSGGQKPEKRGSGVSEVERALPYEGLVSGESILMCIGDSLTELGYGYAQIIEDILREKGYGKVKVIRKAHSGYRVGDIYPLVDGWLEEYPDCKLFTILLGTNDTKTVPNWFAPWKTKYYYFNLIRKIKNRVPDADIRIMRIPYILKDTTDGTFLPWDKWERHKDVVNEIIMALSRRFGMPTPPDLYEVTRDKKEYYVEDGLHFSLEGYKALAPVVIELLKAKADFAADDSYLDGKPYTVKGGVISQSYPDDKNKLTRGKFSTEFGDQIGFSAAENGGDGATVTVDVEFNFNERVLVNNLVFINGREEYNYAPDVIEIYKKVDNEFVLEGRLTAKTENSADSSQMAFFNMYTPKEPFYAEGLRARFTKTFRTREVVNCDWLLIGDISASVLYGYGK